MHIVKIAYIYIEHLDKLKDSLNQQNCDFIEKIQDQTKPEVWVEYSNELVNCCHDFLSSQDRFELGSFNKSTSPDWLLFYS